MCMLHRKKFCKNLQFNFGALIEIGKIISKLGNSLKYKKKYNKMILVINIFF